MAGGAGKGDFGPGIACERKELINLVRAHIGENAAVEMPFEEPVGTGRSVQPVGAEAEGLDDATDGAFGDKLGGAGDGGHLEPFGEIDGPDAARPGLGLAEFREVLRGQAARLVCHHVLARLHGADRDCGAVCRDGGGEDEVDRGIVQEVVRGIDAGRVGEALDEAREGAGGAFGAPPRELCARIGKIAGHGVDVPVINADHAHADWVSHWCLQA